MLVAESQARLACQVGGRHDRVDSLEHRRKRGGAARFDRALVHQARVHVADLLKRPTRAAGRAWRDRFDDRAQIGVDRFGDFGGGGERDALVRDHRAIDPAAVHEPVEIVLRPHGTIERREVETGLERGRLRDGEEQSKEQDGRPRRSFSSQMGKKRPPRSYQPRPRFAHAATVESP